jgi:hypothetical protein
MVEIRVMIVEDESIVAEDIRKTLRSCLQEKWLLRK